MHVRSEQLFSAALSSGTAGRIIQFPLTRILIVVVFLLPVMLLHNAMVGQLLERLPTSYFAPLLDLEFVVNFLLFVVAYRLYTKHVERREALEFSSLGAGREFLLGYAISAGVVLLMVLILAIPGYYEIDGINSWTILIHAFFRFGSGAFVQRLFFSVILFKLCEELLGSWAAMILLAFTFGFAHQINENATVWTSLSLVLSDGILMAAAYMYTRRVWLVWGLHFAWNYVQDGVFGMPNSGITTLESWLEVTTSGPTWLSGGNFGIEASVVAISMQLCVGLVFLNLASRRGQLVEPLWRRR